MDGSMGCPFRRVAGAQQPASCSVHQLATWHPLAPCCHAHCLAPQASLAAALLVRDALVQLAPAEVEASLLAASRGCGSHALPALTPTAGGLHPAGSAAEAAAAGVDGTPTSDQLRGQQGRWAATSSSSEVPGILFKAAATIKEELLLCE